MRSASVSLFNILLMILVLIALLSIIAHETHASPVPSNTGLSRGSDDLYQRITRSHYCGRKLTETLAVLCEGRYPMMSHHRSEYLSDQPQPPVEVEVATLPESGAQRFPYSRSSNHRRVRRAGIYDECCKKSCTYDELRSYCD